MTQTAHAELKPTLPGAGERLQRETARLHASDLTRLNFGCGHFPLDGWTNIDNGDGEWYAAPESDRIIKLDLFEALAALPDDAAAYVYSEHMFEHFTLEQGHAILRQWCRVLAPGGVVRIVCPDLESEARLYLRQIAPAPEEEIDRHRHRWLADRYRFQPGEKLTRAMVLNQGMRLDGHKFIYDEETISQSLSLAGFARITRCAFGASAHAALAGIESHDGGETGRGWVPKVALAIEATKPGVPAPRTTARRVTATEPPAARPAPTAPALAPERYKHRLVELTAQLCAARGYRRIALYGAGRHTASIVREPWNAAGVSVIAVLDDAPKSDQLGGVRVCAPARLVEPVDAVVVSSDTFEAAIFARAREFFGPRGTPVLRIYSDASPGEISTR